MRFLLASVLLALQSAPPVYETRADHDPNGIGKFYMGREIARVITGPEAAKWLERSEREKEEAPDTLVEVLDLKPGMVVADVGAGTGYLSFRMAPKVGKVLAVDIQEEMLRRVREKAEETGAKNVETVLGSEQDPKLPEGKVDLVLLVDVYHEFEWPREMMEGIVKGLRPGGLVALIEYRMEDPRVPMKPVHKMSEEQMKREMAAAGLDWVRTDPRLPWQHVGFFRKPAG